MRIRTFACWHIVAIMCLLGLQKLVTADAISIVSPLRIISFPETTGQTAPVISAVRIHPNGRLLVTAGDDHAVRFWDLRTGELIRQLSGHFDWVGCVAFSPDGKMLATAGNDRRVVLVDVATGNQIHSFSEMDQAISDLKFSHDGNTLAVVGFQNQMLLLDPKSGQVRHSFNCPCRDMRGVAFSSDDRLLAAGGRNGRIRIWDMQSGRTIHTFKAHRQRIRAITFSNNDQRIISAGEDRQVRVWDVTTAEALFSLPRMPGKVFTLVSCGPRCLATAGSDNIIYLWDLHRKRLVARLSGHTGSIASMDFSGHILVSGSFDTTVRVWPIGGLATFNVSEVSPPNHGGIE